MTFLIGTPHTHNAGYHCNDDRASGGLKDENDVQTCPHCQAVIKMQLWKDNGGWCSKCEKPLCSNPTCIAETNKYGCVPFFKKIEQHVESTIKYEQFLKISGLEKPQERQLILPP